MNDLFTQVCIKQDSSLHWYIIPKHLESDRNLLDNKLQELEEYSDERNDVCDQIEDKFGKYRTGGSIDCGTDLYCMISELGK